MGEPGFPHAERNACGEAKARACLRTRTKRSVSRRGAMESSWRGRSSGRSCSLERAAFSRRFLGRSRSAALRSWRSVRLSRYAPSGSRERTRVVVTTEKVFVVGGTWRKRARAVRLAAVEAVELEQTFLASSSATGQWSWAAGPRPRRAEERLPARRASSRLERRGRNRDVTVRQRQVAVDRVGRGQTHGNASA